MHISVNAAHWTTVLFNSSLPGTVRVELHSYPGHVVVMDIPDDPYSTGSESSGEYLVGVAWALLMLTNHTTWTLWWWQIWWAWHVMEREDCVVRSITDRWS